MRARPILFSGAMVRALLDGTKTQTRRVVKGAPPETDHEGLMHRGMAHFGIRGRAGTQWETFHFTHGEEGDANPIPCPYGVPGDLLYVRETWKPHSIYAAVKPREIPRSKAFYRADEAYAPSNTPWVPGIHQPRWASRLTLLIDDVRIERLNAISDADARAEGIVEIAAPDRRDGMRHFGVPGLKIDQPTPARAYIALWTAINGQASADADPWVWVVSFEVQHRNVDAVLAKGSGS